MCEIFGPKISFTKGADVNVFLFFFLRGGGGRPSICAVLVPWLKPHLYGRVRRLRLHIRLRDRSLQVSWIWALTQRNSFNSQRFVQADMDVVGGFYKKNWGELFFKYRDPVVF